MRTPTDADVAQAGIVLKAVKQLDPYFVNADVALARGWAMVFARFSYTTEEMLEGVVDFYTHETGGRHCMPAHVVQGAKRARERAMATDPARREELERKRLDNRDARDARLRAGILNGGQLPQLGLESPPVGSAGAENAASKADSQTAVAFADEIKKMLNRRKL